MRDKGRWVVRGLSNKLGWTKPKAGLTPLLTHQPWIPKQKILVGILYTLSMFLEKLGFTALAADMTVFVRQHAYIAVYVVDLLIVGPLMTGIFQVKAYLSKRFDMTYLGACYYYPGISVYRNRAQRTLY